MAIARLYQQQAIEKAVTRHKRHRAATLVLPTGAGKTVVAAFFILQTLLSNPDATFLFLQHTEELLEQNMSTVARITGLSCSVVMADSNDWTGRVVFASVPTLSRAARLNELGSFSNLIADECHHSAAPSWMRIIDRARKLNAKLRILGLSATPEPPGQYRPTSHSSAAIPLPARPGRHLAARLKVSGSGASKPTRHSIE